MLINPMIVDGQIMGGTAQGIGARCSRKCRSMRKASRWPRHSPTICLPGTAEVPNIRVLHMETPSPYTEFGIKGVGEGGAIGPGAAIANAINDAMQAIRR